MPVHPAPPPTLATTPRALAELRYNSILANSDAASSSDDDLPFHHEDIDDDEESTETARNAIGVSIGRAQTRLTSPKTPAIEKQAAIERVGGFFEEPDVARVEEEGDSEVEEDDDDGEGVPPTAGGVLPGRRTDVRVSSSGKPAGKEGKVKTGLLAGLPFTRKRAATASGSESMLDGLHRALLSTWPLSRRSSSGSLGGSKAQSREVDERSNITSKGPGQGARQRSADAVPQLNRKQSPEDAERAEASMGELSSMPQIHPIRSRPGVLRRSTSDGSLVTTRTLSQVSSLGDDSRFEDVREQVNSRFKAIKDSWQDSNIKLPSMPKSISVASFTPDFLHNHTGSIGSWMTNSRDDSERTSKGAIPSDMKTRKPVDPMTRQPYNSARDIARDATSGKHATHPHFRRALERLDGDLVILGGYRGSILRSAEPPHRQVWVPVKVGLNLRKVNLEVDFEEGAEERATETIIPGGMLTHIGPVDIARRLFKRLKSSDNARDGLLRVHDYGYDWRLDPNFLSKQLVQFLETLPCNQPGVPKEKRGATVIAHSLGGLITRHAVNQRPELFRGVIYAGVPKTCVNILGPLRNGDEVLISSRVLTAQVNFSIRTSFALLPLDGRCFFDKETKEEYHVDFFDPQSWIDYRFSPCIARPLPPLATPEKPSGITGYMSSMASALPNIPIPGRKTTDNPRTKDPFKMTTINGAAEPDTDGVKQANSEDIVANGNIDSTSGEENPNEQTTSARTTVTVPRDTALAYLTRTLASVKQFKQELAFNPAHAAANKYPPAAVIYGKSTPTVYGAKVSSREGIKHADAYDELAFASGDGVVLARAAMVPEGYRTVRGGIVSSERGHVTLLGDLEAVGRCLNAIVSGRRKGVGLGR